MKRTVSRLGAVTLIFVLAFIGAPMIALAQTNIEVWDLQPDNVTGIGKFFVQLQQEFDRSHPDIKVTHSTWPAGDWQQAIATQIASKTGATVIRGVLNSSIAVGFGVKGYLMDLAPYVNAWDDWKTVYATAKLDVTQPKTTHVYSIPDGIDVVLLAYRADMAKAAGLNADKGPQTWEELRTWAKKLTDRKVNRAGYSILASANNDWWFEYYVWQAGGDLTSVDAKGKITLNFTSKPVQDAIKLYRDFYWTDKSSQTNPMTGFGPILNDWYQDRMAMTLFYPTWIPWQVPNGMKMDKVNLAAQPKGPKGTATAFSMQTNGIVSWASKAQADASFEYIKWMQGKANMIRSLQYAQDNEIIWLAIPAFEDIDFSKYLTIVPQQWVKPIIDSVKTARAEYAGKGPLSPYVSNAVNQSLMAPANATAAQILAIWKGWQDQAYLEYLNAYNDAMK
jgi:ABC-type glycerol-3-phosphate transport system substrate-binding protein